MAPDTSSINNRVYSKSSENYFRLKRDYVRSNQSLLADAVRQNHLYTDQIKRMHCKLCGTPLSQDVDFTSHNVQYVFCKNCGHLNGCFDDTQEFANSLYIIDNDSEYSFCYTANDYDDQCVNIYAPKSSFLTDNLPAGDHKILDVGCGSGYFVYAALKQGLSATGIDVNSKMIEYGNHNIHALLGQRPLSLVSESEFLTKIAETDANVISAVGVIEHLRDPHAFFQAFALSKAQYLFYSVPMFSLSVYLEIQFPDVFPRQLSGGHTHLFTEDSLLKFYDLLGVNPTAEWRFGTDMIDLFRSLTVRLTSRNISEHSLAIFQKMFGACVDKCQAALDTTHFCSEIHGLAIKRSAA